MIILLQSQYIFLRTMIRGNRGSNMNKLICMAIGVGMFLFYTAITFILGFATSQMPRKFEENIINAYVISCIIGAGMTVAFLVERGVLVW